MPPRGGGVRVPIDGDVTGLNRALAQAEGSLSAFGTKAESIGKKLDSTGKTLTRTLTLPIVGAGVAAGKLAFDFEDSMNKVLSLSDTSQKQMQAWSRQVIALAPAVAKSPNELAKALYQVASSGVKTTQVMDVLTDSAKLSAIGLGDTGTVADLLTSSLNSYAKEGLGAARASDILTAAVQQGKGEADQMAQVMGNILPIAENLGVGFADAAAAVAAMTTQTGDADLAATNLSQILSSILKPAAQSRKAMEEVGLSADGVRKELREKGLLATLMDLSEHLKGNDDALGKLFPNIRALRGFLQLTGAGAQKYAEITDKVTHSTGDMGAAFRKTADSDVFKMRQSLSELQADGVKAGSVLLPIAADIAGKFTDVVDAIEGLSGTQKALLGWSAAAVAAIGPVARIVGTTSKGIGGLAKLLGLGLGKASGGVVGSTTSMLGVQKVLVVNWPPGFNAPVNPASRSIPGIVGTTGRGAGAAIPGVGTIGAAGGIGAGGALAIGGVLIAGGVALDKINQKTGFLGPAFGPSEKDAAKQQQKIQDAIIAAWRKGGPAVIDEMKKWSLTAAITGPPMLAAAKKGIDVFRDAITAGGPKVKHSTKEVLGAAIQGLSGLSPQAQQLAADSMVRMSRTLENQGRLPVGSTKKLVAALTAEIGTLPGATQAAARGVAGALGGLVSTLGSVKSAVDNVARSLASLPSAPPSYSLTGPGGRNRASGGFIPGTFDGRDDVPVNLSRGEVVLNPSQQRIVGIDRIVGALHATGGVMGGSGFAKGGIVDDVYSRIAAKMGTKYVYGSWDCSKFATYAAGVDVGGTTASAYADSRPAKGNEPIQWGFRKSHPGGYVGGPQEHMGIGVWHNGKMVWFDNGGHAGGSYVGSDADSSRWQDFRVPDGLEGLSRSDSIDTKKNTRGKGHAPLLSKAAIARIIGAGSGIKVTPSRGDVLQDRLDARHRDDSLQDKRASAGAISAAQGRGITDPDKLAAIGDKAVDQQRRTEIAADAGDVTTAFNKAVAARKAGRLRLGKLYGQLRKAKTRAREQALIGAINDQRQKNGELTVEIKGYIKQNADLQAEADELDYDIQQLDLQIAAPSATDATGTDTSTSPDAQAQIDQANARADVATRASAEFGAFFTAVRNSGTDDRSGGITVVQNNFGGVIQQDNVASYIVDALNRQGAPSASRIPVPA